MQLPFKCQVQQMFNNKELFKQKAATTNCSVYYVLLCLRRGMNTSISPSSSMTLLAFLGAMTCLPATSKETILCRASSIVGLSESPQPRRSLAKNTSSRSWFSFSGSRSAKLEVTQSQSQLINVKPLHYNYTCRRVVLVLEWETTIKCVGTPLHTYKASIEYRVSWQ